MKKVFIEKDQYLGDVIPFIPSNTIIFKNVTGIGATTLELKYPRHSIIIEPNVPVIQGKKKKHKDILAIYKGVNSKHIADYLKNDEIKYKKIVTTPESFEKIISACYEARFDLYNDFFLLFDECDRLCKDVDFRESITDPLFHFFQFKEKAFISATAIEPSDPKFKENDFKYLSIVPTYSIEKKISLFTTNNPYNILQELFNKNNGKKNFIFLNATKPIEKLISFLKIQDKSAIFCSDRSLENISESVSYSSSSLDEEHFKEYNFFTSRFFSAVDFDVDYDCNVYLVTDVNLAEYSAIDPKTDAIQIIGRFRNKSIDLNIHIISNADQNLNCRTVEDSRTFLYCTEKIYTSIFNYRKTTKDKTILEVLNLTLDVLPFKKFLDVRGKKSYFKFDNYMYNNRVLSYYLNYDNLFKAYTDCNIVDSEIHYFKVTHQTRDYFYDSTMLTYRKLFKSYGDNVKKIGKLLLAFENPTVVEDDKIKIENILNGVELYFPEVFEAYSNKIDLEEICECKSKEQVLALIKEHIKKRERKSFTFIEDLRDEFPVNSSFTGDAFREKFKKLIDQHQLSLDPTIKEAKNFLEISQRFKGKGDERNVWFYKVIEHK